MYVTHIRLTFGGPLGEGAQTDQWACSLALGGEGTDAVILGPTQEELGLAADAVGQWITRPASHIARVARLAWVKAAVIGPDGRYTGDMVQVVRDLPGGGGTENLHPLQVSNALSLRTGLRGPSRRGRFYAPAPAVGIGADGLITTGDAGSMAASAAQMLTALNAAIPGAARVVVASNKGFNTAVNAVACGRALDTMRSRRASLAEQYPAAAAVAA